MNKEEFDKIFQLGRDYLIAPYELPVVEPDHPGEIAPPPRRVKCYECAYCQFSTLHVDELIRHFTNDRTHPFKYPATGVHPGLVEVHPELAQRHQDRIKLNTGLSADVEEFEQAAPQLAAFGKTPALVTATSAVPVAIKEVK